MRLSTTFGRRLAAIRKHRGLTQAALAYAIGKSRPTINRWESGTAIDIRTGDAESCACALQCRVRDLYAPADAPVPPPLSSSPRRTHRRIKQVGKPDKTSSPDEVERLEALLVEVLQRLVRYEPAAMDLLDRIRAPSGLVSDGRRAA